MTTSLAAFTVRMSKAPEQIRSTRRDMVRVAALAVTVAERQALSAATHGTNRLRGVGRNGVKLGVGFDIKGGTDATALVRARGPWHLIESDTKAHVIAPRKRRRAMALAGKGFGPVARVQHPGTKGKHPWRKGLAEGIPAASRASQMAAGRGVAKAFLG